MAKTFPRLSNSGGCPKQSRQWYRCGPALSTDSGPEDEGYLPRSQRYYPVLPGVLAAMLPFFEESPGNPSSGHTAGGRRVLQSSVPGIRLPISLARRLTMFYSPLRRPRPSTRLFTPPLLYDRGKRSRIVITAVEHAAVQQYALAAEKSGMEVIQIPVSTSGALALDRLDDAISAETCVASVMWANNETGVVFPHLANRGALCRSRCGIARRCGPSRG